MFSYLHADACECKRLRLNALLHVPCVPMTSASAIPTTLVAHYDERYRRRIHKLDLELPGVPGQRSLGHFVKYPFSKRGVATLFTILLELVILFVGLMLAPVVLLLFALLP